MVSESKSISSPLINNLKKMEIEVKIYEREAYTRNKYIFSKN